MSFMAGCVINLEHPKIQIQKQKMDFSSESSREAELGRAGDEKSGLRNKDKAHCIPSFISKTYEILEKDQHSNIIVWGETGANFYVKNIKEFEEKILPIYFRHKNFASFVRQLNMYDFHKIRGEQKHIFEHKLFRKGAHYLLQDIKRKCFKKSKEDEADQNPEEQPEIEEVKPKRTPLAVPPVQNCKQDQAHKVKLLEKERERQKLYQLMSEEHSKNRKRNLELMEEIVAHLREINPQSELEIRQQINVIRSNPRYQSLRGKYYIYQIYKKLKESLYEMRPRNTVQDLQELSIEQQILYNEIEKPSRVQITSLTNFETENFMKSSHHTIKHIYGEEFFSKEMF